MSINEDHPVQLTTVSASFSDIDELTHNMAGWDGDWRQLEAGRPHNRIEVIAGQHTALQQFYLSHSIHQLGKAPGQSVSFGFSDNQSQLNYNGKEINCPVMLDFNGESGYECVSRSDFRAVTVSFSKEKFSRIAEQLELPATRFTGSSPPPYLLSDENYALGEFRQYLHSLCESLHKAKTPKEHHFAMLELDKELPVRLLTALAASSGELCDQPLKVRQKGLRLAVEFIEAYHQYNPGIPDICTATGLSWRSLDRAFKECFGIGPKRYLLNLRLTQVRRQLKSAPPRTKVVDMANDWGFWHMGDFAREYRKIFCESPAESLAR